jgi:hypothetical protein
VIALWLALAAGAAELQVVATDGPVHPGRPCRIEAVILDDVGAAVLDVVPVPAAGAARVEPRSDGPAGVVTLLWVPPETVGPVTWTVPELGISTELVVQPVPAPTWTTPARLDVFDGQPIRLVVSGPGRPLAGALEVSTSEAAAVEVTDKPEGAVVSLVPTGTGARVLLVALHDLGGATAPRVVSVRILDRPTLSFDLERGASLQVRIGGRSYGPFLSDGAGPVRARIEQYPGERQAELVVRDDLGNELVTPYVLSARADPSITMITAGRPWPGQVAPQVLVAAARSDGRAWTGAPPSCRGPDVGEMDLVRVEAGLWRIVDSPRIMAGRDHRLDCRLGEAVTTHRVEAPLGVPVSVDLKVYPEEVSTDFPVAEVTARVLDASGERLPADDVEVVAGSGAVALDAAEGRSRRGEYRGGAEAIRDGSDRLTASLRLRPAPGLPARVQVAHGSVPRSGTVRVHGRALAADGRPIPGVSVRLSAGAAVADVASGDDGWASAQLDPGSDGGAVVLRAAVGQMTASALRPRSSLPHGGGPGQPDLVATRTILLSAGRVSTLRIQADTPVLYATPGARLTVRIYLYDRGENLVVDEIPVLAADQGALGPPRLGSDGGFEAEYVPEPDTRGGVVTIVARAPTGSASATFRLRLELRPVRAAFGPAIGVLTNFGGITSLTVNVDGDIRLPALNDQLMLRIGVAGYTTSREVDTGAGVNVKRLTLVPITLGALVRQERGQTAGWLGLGATLAPFRAVERFDDERFPARTGVLPPGFVAMVGGARRIRGGEAFLEIRGAFLSSPGGAVGFTGQVGGLGAVLGYRLVFD